jgi:hypothetical protein
LNFQKTIRERFPAAVLFADKHDRNHNFSERQVTAPGKS